MKELTKGLEEAKKEKERLVEEKEKLRSAFREIEQKAFKVQENYKHTQQVLLCLLSFCICHRLILAVSRQDNIWSSVDVDISSIWVLAFSL